MDEQTAKLLVAMSSSSDQENSNSNSVAGGAASSGAGMGGATTKQAAPGGAPTTAATLPSSTNSNSSVLATSQQQNATVVTAATVNKQPWDYTAEEQLAKKESLISQAWERGYQSLLVYKTKHGNTFVPYRYEGDRSLGTWTARQRKDKGNLSSLQVQKLEVLGFTWESAQERVWLEKFGRLKSYFGKNGNSCVPTSYAQDPELGEWTAKQRQKYTQGRLSTDRQQLLNTVGFVYRINKFIKRKSTAREDSKWFSQLERLIHFLLEHGHTLVPFQYVADKSLGRWVNEQRCQNMRELLREDRKTILSSIGFVWKVASRKGELKLLEDASAEARWSYCFRELVEYKSDYGDFKVPTTTGHAKAELGQWAVEQRKLMQNGKLEEMVAQRFAAIGFCSAGESKIWEKNYDALLKAGYTSVYTLSDPCLSHWVICQRYLYKKQTLSNERKVKFFEVNGFSWDSTPLNLPKPEPKHILKAKAKANKKRQQMATSSASSLPVVKPVRTTKRQKLASLVARATNSDANPADDASATASEESEGEEEVGDLVI